MVSKHILQLCSAFFSLIVVVLALTLGTSASLFIILFAFIAACLTLLHYILTRLSETKDKLKADSIPSKNPIAPIADQAIVYQNNSDAIILPDFKREEIQKATIALIDSLALAPFARAILADVPGKTEEATMMLINKAMLIKEKTAHEATLSIQATETSKDTKNEFSLPMNIQRTHEAIKQIYQRINSISTENNKNSDFFKTMNNDVKTGIALLQGMEELTQQSQVIAINLAIEAAHIGNKGQGFQVIASELHKLNIRSVDYSEKIRSLLKSLSAYNDTFITNILTQSSSMATSIEQSYNSSSDAVEALINASKQTEHFSNAIASLSLEIDADLQILLESLQFQDITRQMVEGAIQIIDDLVLQLHNLKPVIEILDQPSQTVIQDRKKQLQTLLSDRSKTIDEKNAILGVTL